MTQLKGIEEPSRKHQQLSADNHMSQISLQRGPTMHLSRLAPRHAQGITAHSLI